MKKSKLLILSLTFLIVACDGSSNDGSGDLGRQIDSMGRAAINTALINTFEADSIRGAAEDIYNATNNFERANYRDEMAKQLAVYDALAGTCGDNPVTNRASASPADGQATGANRYDFLATVLADDHLYVNSSSGGAIVNQCNQYLSAELGVIGITGLEADCGGRTPNYDTILTTYSVVAVGAASGVDDGVVVDNRTHSLSVFPFLAPAS